MLNANFQLIANAIIAEVYQLESDSLLRLLLFVDSRSAA
jgi:hypothetical protein